MSINSFRSFLYGAAKGLGNVQAVDKAFKTGSTKPIAKRIGRVYAGKGTSRLLSKLFR